MLAELVLLSAFAAPGAACQYIPANKGRLVSEGAEESGLFVKRWDSDGDGEIDYVTLYVLEFVGERGEAYRPKGAPLFHLIDVDKKYHLDEQGNKHYATDVVYVDRAGSAACQLFDLYLDLSVPSAPKVDKSRSRLDPRFIGLRERLTSRSAR